VVIERPLFNSLRTVWCYSQTNFDLPNESDWNSVFSNASNANQLWSTWQKRFLEIMEICIPQKTTYLKKHLPWLSPSLHSAMRIEAETLLSDHSNTMALVNGFQEYKRQRNLGTTAIRLTKTSFLNHLHHAGPKTFWMIIKLLSKQSSNIPMLSCGDSFATSDYDKANCLNNQFYNHFNHSYLHYHLFLSKVTQTLWSQCVTLHWRWSFWTDTWALVHEIYWTWWNLSQDAK